MVKPDFTIDKKEVLRYRGHRSETALPHIDRLAQEMTEKIYSSISPRHIMRRFSVTQTEDGVLLDSGLLLQGQDIKKHLSGCDKCYIFCATVGVQADNFIRSQLALGSVYGLMADAAATAAIEAYCDTLENDLRNRLKEEKSYLTWRYSPGYGDFPFTQQPDILDLLQAEKYAGITCSESCLMIPAKSVTAVMGEAKIKPVEKTRSCDRCPNRENCNFSCR